MNRVRLALIILLSCITIQGFSCSGENVGEIIERNIDFGRTSFTVCVIVSIIIIGIQRYFRLFKSWLAITILVLLLLILIGHPHHWFTGMDGDCGFALAEWSIYALIGLTVLFLVTVVIAVKHVGARKIT